MVHTVFFIFGVLLMFFALGGFLRGLWASKPQGGSSSSGYDGGLTGGSDGSGHGGDFGGGHH